MLNPRRLSAFRALWRAVAHGRRPDAPRLGERLRALPRMAGASLAGRYPGLGRGRLALFVLGLVYLVSPVDLVPELLFKPFNARFPDFELLVQEDFDATRFIWPQDLDGNGMFIAGWRRKKA